MRPLLLAGLLLAFPAARGATREATILYVTDAHEIAPVVDRHGDRGGVARLKTVVDRVRRRQPAALLVFGGDLAGGTLFGGVFRGEPMVEALGRVGVGLATFGQHEFDFGSNHARRLVSLSRFPWLTTNLVDRSGLPFAGLPATRLIRVGGLRVGFLGLTDDMSTTMQDVDVFQRDLVAAARAAADALRREGAEAIVALTQTGAAINERLMREVGVIDAILTEEEAEERSVVRFVGSRPMAAPCGNLGSVVELHLSATGDGVRAAVMVHPVDGTVPSDPVLEADEKRYMGLLEERLAGSVGFLAQELTEEHSREGETALGDLVADSFREAAGADLALAAGSSLRAGLPAGVLTLRHVFSLLPFGNRVVALQLTGSALRQVLETSLAGRDRGTPSVLQVSGLSYSADTSAPAGSRLRDVRMGDAPVREDALYRVAVSSHLAGGAEGFSVLSRATRLDIAGGDPLDADALCAHLRRLGREGPIPAGSGRITLSATPIARP
jgi:5'-nucleotidase